MSHEDTWRRRMVEERYGDSLTPGFARAGAAPPPSQPSFAYVAPSRAAPPPRRTLLPYLGWVVAGVLAMILAALVGWTIRGGDLRRIVYIPVASPAVSTPAGGPSVAPRIVPPPLDLALPTGDAAMTGPSVADEAKPAKVASDAVPPAKTPHPKSPPDAKPRARPVRAQSVPPAPAVPRVAVPAFACIPGTGPASAALCADPTFRTLDEQRQAALAQVFAHGDPPLIVVARQSDVRFVHRRDKCRDNACLTRVYTDVIVTLVGLLPAGAATPPVCLPQQYTRTPLMNCWPSHLRPFRRPFYSK